MVNGGLLAIAIIDDHKAKLWVQVFTQLKAREDLAINTGGEIGWAVRKNSPLLLKELNEFAKTHGVKTSFGAEVMRKYYRSSKIVQNVYSKADQEEYQSLVVFFKKYATEYGFDYLMLAAQGFQESRLKQSTHSPMGAVGVMQLLPKTAADPKIAVNGIETNPERNIEAGTKYLRLLTDTYLNDPDLDQKNKTLIAFAAYNAGPGNLQRFRKWAKDSGLDPNIWFNNVEAGAARIVGQETVTYVSNIYKYYVAYRLLTERQAAAEQSRKATNTGQGG